MQNQKDKRMHIEKEDNILKYISILFIILTLFFAFYLTASISLRYKGPIGDDFRFHLKAATLYSEGKNAMLSKDIWAYPPLFHLFLAIFVKLGGVVQAAAFMQAIFYPLVLLVTAWLVWKKKNIVAAAFTIVLMFTSIGLFDRVQVTPQSVDMILFPLAVFFFLEQRKIPFVTLMLIMIYSHGYLSLLLLGGLALFSFVEKMNRNFIITTALFSLPLILFFLPYLPSYIHTRLPEILPLTEPLFLIGYASLIITLFLPIALLYSFMDRKNLDGLDKICLYWLLASFLMAFLFPDRIASYSVVPASIIISKMFYRFTSINKLAGIIVAIFLLVQIFLFGFFINFMKWWNMLHGIGMYRFNIA